MSRSTPKSNHGSNHVDAAAHTRGESRYVSDLPYPAGMRHAAVFGSPLAHGHLCNIDTRAALEMPGVVAILTAADIPGENQIGPLIQDEHLLAENEVHFIGQPIAIVVAASPEIAHKAVKAIKAAIDLLPVITDPREAYAQDETIGAVRTFSLGDIDSAWEKCAHIAEGRCDCGGQEHVYLETQAARAVRGEGDAVTIWSSTQSPYAVQRMAAKVLGISHHNVEVDVKRLGGGFGGKEDQATPWACLAALAAWCTGQPVELVLNRHDDLMMTGKRHPYSADFKIGLDEDGRILAYEVFHYQNAGAAADLSPAILERTLFHSTNAYFIPHVSITAASCRTNLPPNTAFRGFGGPQGMFAIESAIARAAEVSGLSREAIQRVNLISDGQEFSYGQTAEAAHAVKTWDIAASTYRLEKLKANADAFNAGSDLIKKGVAVMPICFGISFTATFMNQGSALVHVYTDGSVNITTGGVEMGQGISTKIRDIAARELQIAPERIQVQSTNTTRIANMSPSAASATTDLCGGAVVNAIAEIMARLRTFAARELGFDEAEKIRVENERVCYAGKATEWDWPTLVRNAYLARISLSAHGFFTPANIWFDKSIEKGRPFTYHVYGCGIFEVTVDCLRGTYDIDAVHLVHDLGRPMNERVDMGQIEGGLAQGLGWMTMEDLQYGANGQLLSGALASYKVPEVYFTPKQLNVTLLEDADNPHAPYGSKAVGEPPLLYGIGVFFALRNALQAYRPQRQLGFHAPMTPERALLELHGGELAIAKNHKKEKAPGKNAIKKSVPEK